MSERIDHVAEALRVARQANGKTTEQAVPLVAVAQVHATLALVEQQRIANLIALGRTGRVAPGTIFNEQLSSFDFDSPQTLRPEIREALGL